MPKKLAIRQRLRNQVKNEMEIKRTGKLSKKSAKVGDALAKKAGEGKKRPTKMQKRMMESKRIRKGR